MTVNGSKSETLVLDKDSSGKLWITWMESGKVKVNRTVGSDQVWGTPFDLPGQGGSVNSDDISSVVAFGGNKIGIMWSNQKDKKMYFAVHLDGDADTQWQGREDALADGSLGAVADDHINLKQSCAGDGALYAATKTSLSGSDPLVYLLKRAANGSWSRHVIGTGSNNHTRPIVLLDGNAGRAYVFASSNRGGGREKIYMKSAPTSDLQFPSGLGTPFIDSQSESAGQQPDLHQAVSRARHRAAGAEQRPEHPPLPAPLYRPRQWRRSRDRRLHPCERCGGHAGSHHRLSLHRRQHRRLQRRRRRVGGGGLR